MTGLLEHPEWVGWIAALLALAGVVVVDGWLGARRRLSRLLGARRPTTRGQLGRDALLLFALLAIGTALLGPRTGVREVRVSTAGADVALLVDVSRSMDARDVPPSRLARARAGAAALLSHLSAGDRVALAAFAGRGVAFTPLTPDRDALIRMLPALDSTMLRPGGTDLGAGIEAALGVFEAGSRRPRSLVVWSDGELRAPLPSTAQDTLQRSGTRLVAVALGTEAGGRVPDGGMPLRDEHDRIVISRRDVGALDALAAATGGELFVADEWGEIDPASLAAAVDRELLREPARGGEHVMRSVVAPEWRPYAAIAFALLLVEPIAPALRRLVRALRRRTRALRRRRTAARLAGLAAAALALLGVAADEGAHDAGGARSHLLRGLEQARDGEPDAAERSFEASAILAEDPGIGAVALQNLGVLALERGDLERARDAFFEALRRMPDDYQLRFNAEWTLLALAAQARDEEPPMLERADPEPARSPLPDESASAAAEPGEDEAPGLPEAPQPDAGDATSEGPDRGAGGHGAQVSERATPMRPLLDAEERTRWLERVEDEPGRSMRLTARAEDARDRTLRGRGAAW